jgi:hypothetical protein
MIFTLWESEHVMKKSRFTEAQIAFTIKQHELGMQVNEIISAEQKRMFEKVSTVYAKNATTISADAINIVIDALKKSRGG